MMDWAFCRWVDTFWSHQFYDNHKPTYHLLCFLTWELEWGYQHVLGHLLDHFAVMSLTTLPLKADTS
jgi:hypothetical protein